MERLKTGIRLREPLDGDENEGSFKPLLLKPAVEEGVLVTEEQELTS